MGNDYIDPDEEREEMLEGLLLNEKQLLDGLIKLGRGKEEHEYTRKIKIERDGAVCLEFRVRPVSEDESDACWRGATKYARSKPGQPKIAVETDRSLYRSFLIYTATLDEDKQKTWDNRQAQVSFNIFRGVDMIDIVLRAGEKNRVIEIIEEISGYDTELDGHVKN